MNFKEQIEMSYLAGVMDGDGSFSLAKRNAFAERSPLYYPLIQLGSLSKDLVDFAKEKLGGSTRLNKSRVCKDGILRRDFYVWKAEKSNQCMEALEKVSNFLVVKKERALYLRNYISENPFIRGSNLLSQEVLERREYSYRIMREFNSSQSYKIGFSRKTASLPTDNELFWSYLAGLIDTDGSLSIRRNKATSISKNYRYSPIISLSMNDISGLNHIKENCSFGSFMTYKAKTCVKGILNRWTGQRREEVIEILKRIIPYLLVKKENAKILLNFCENYTPVFHRQASIPKDELDFREKCYQELIHINKYGVLKPSLIDLEAHDMGDRAEAKAP